MIEKQNKKCSSPLAKPHFTVGIFCGGCKVATPLFVRFRGIGGVAMAKFLAEKNGLKAEIYNHFLFYHFDPCPVGLRGA